MDRRIVYVSWPAREISGGIKLCYRHVEALMTAGVAAVVATEDGTGPGWFATSAQTVLIESLAATGDLLVLPENHTGYLQRFQDWSGAKFVFCQNHFMCYRGLAGKRCYSEFGITDILAEGGLVRDYCHRRFPKLRVWPIPVGIDIDVFRPGTQKHMQIAFAPRKRPLEAEFIRDLFSSDHPEYKEVPWISIHGCSEERVAQILRDSAIYLSLCRFEAFPLSILEALASGCIVAGFTGWGGKLFTTAANGYWAREDDCFEALAQLVNAVQLVRRGDAGYRDVVQAAVRDARRLSHKHLDNQVVQFWKTYLTT